MESTGAALESVYAALKGAATLDGVNVYSRYEEAPAFPYIEVGNVLMATPFETVRAVGDTVNITVDIFSNKKGKSEVQDLAEKVHAVLDKQSLTCTLTLIGIERADYTILEEWDGTSIVYHASLRYRLYISP